MFHVDDLKISHKNPEVVTSVIDALSKKYGGIMPLSISRGKVHDYLGIVFDYATSGQVSIHMYHYISELLDNVPDRYRNGIGSTTPAPGNLYTIRSADDEDVRLLPSKEKDEYHSLTTQCLYLSKRARPDLQTSMAFHCTRAQKPDEDDEKLGRPIRYLDKTNTYP